MGSLRRPPAATHQASFYADDVRPYLSLDHASRETFYRAKKDAIQKRQALWTSKIEDISIRKESPGKASTLTKLLHEKLAAVTNWQIPPGVCVLGLRSG